PDNSPAICDELVALDERIKVIHLEKNGGASNARNVGISKANGRYVYFMDSDDVIENNLFEIVNINIEKTSAQVVMFGAVEDYFDKNDNLYNSIRINYREDFLSDEKSVRKEIIDIEDTTLFGYLWNKFYLLQIVKDKSIEFVNMSLNEDFKFNIDLFQFVCSLSTIDFIGYHYKKRDNQSLTGRFVANYFDLQIMRISELLSSYKKWNLCDEHILRILGKIYVRAIFSAIQRNCDKNANLNFSSRKQWIENQYTQNLFLELIPFTLPSSKIVKIMLFLLKKQYTFALLLMGRLMFFVKKKFPMVFSRIKQNK
ncbi:MAG: glycosyltransferase, partial [Oscillospiraceae bacterium]